MGQYNLSRVFKPDNIAVIGASEIPETIGNAVMTNLMAGGFSSNILPVNPKYEFLHGKPCSRYIEDIEAEVDLAVIATPIQTVPDIVRSCVKQKIGSAIIISAGGKETGEKGKQIEQDIQKTAYEGGLRIVGPNCLGVICPKVKMNASFASEMPLSGNLAFISQSGAICTAVLDFAFRENFGFSHFISIGSMLDVDFGDLIDYLGNDPSTRSILLYIENLTNIRKFMSAARAVSRIKPIIVLKAGKSDAGAKAAASHTGALAGEDSVYEAAFKRAGIVRVKTIQDLFDCAELLAKQPRPAGPGLAIITNGGGPGVMATDILADYGQTPAILQEETIEKLNSVLPAFWSKSNPIDILGDATPERFCKVLDICFESKGIHGLLLILAPQALSDPMAIAKIVVTTMKNRKFPVVTCWMGGERIAGAVEFLNKSGVPTYETPERAVQAFLYLRKYAKNLAALTEIPPRLAHHLEFDREKARHFIRRSLHNEFMSDLDCKEVLAAYGLPVLSARKAESETEAVEIAGDIGYPLVMKILSPDITHKTEAGGVQLDLRSEDREFFNILSLTSIYYRFFTPIKEPKPEMLARFTQIDYDREIALVAILEKDGNERLLGVARVIGDPDGKNGEFSVLIGDPWQDKGIGAMLLQNCLDIFRARGFKTIMGFVLLFSRRTR
ncbi:bifunctional acetate--CoA ligase family protein/GNAT family N-acetyltransferase [Desulfobacula toluolica]|uniref:Predicted acetyl-CoA synthetase / acetyltransferase, GNAT family n=1 Tax=Desulfobacula toluolica (strain DSM 7467 / Tol2) TaxID=651182 RepID=K0NHF8_DESTT|nr:GNAT family N-acetyltransferase [Desulfobacula toluolica]CCK80721.1 predicted acetyl-CoA synthetase / acetyltransferase, GNAT family [Desulfobacula toluolica Tol2]